MFGPAHYFPVVKWKRGEQVAVSKLARGVKGRLTPIIEVVEISLDLDTGEPTKALDDHAARALDQIEKCWGNESVFFLDCQGVSDEESSEGDPGPSYIFAEASNRDLPFIPVIGLQRTLQEIESALELTEYGICLRLTLDDFESDDLGQALTNFLKMHEIDATQTDLIVDLGSIEGSRLSVVRVLAQQFLQAVPDIHSFRTLILTGSAFPNSMGIVPPNSYTYVQRCEWLVWKYFYEHPNEVERLPNFSDYGIQHPEGVEGFDPRYMDSSAAIRYTKENTWLLIKGESMKKKGGAQYKRLAGELVGMKDYDGEKHCYGCETILACHRKTKSAASQEIWRRIGTNHHFTVVTGQLSQLSFP